MVKIEGEKLYRKRNLPCKRNHHSLQIPYHQHIQDDINIDTRDTVSSVSIPYLLNILYCTVLELWACKMCVDWGKGLRNKTQNLNQGFKD